jgi:hypothetical protein
MSAARRSTDQLGLCGYDLPTSFSDIGLARGGPVYLHCYALGRAYTRLECQTRRRLPRPPAASHRLGITVCSVAVPSAIYHFSCRAPRRAAISRRDRSRLGMVSYWVRDFRAV